MTDQPTTLHECLFDAKQAAKAAAAFAEAVDLFPHDAAVAKRFAAEAAQAAHRAARAAAVAVTFATQAGNDQTRAEAAQVERKAQRVQAYADTAAEAAAQAKQSVQAARPFVPTTGALADLERVRQKAYYAWVSCPDPEGSVRLAVLRVQVEEAEAAVQATLKVPALA